MRLHQLTLTQYRNFENYQLAAEGDSCVFLGANGAGKTNLLESISLLAAGRGLRGANLAQLQRQPDAGFGWGVAIKLQSDQADEVSFATGQTASLDDKRVLLVDGQPLKAQSKLAEHFAVLWQTPQMDGLFTQGASERRRYYDRLVSVFFPQFSALLAKYEYLRRERMKLLQQLSARGADDSWLRSLELKLAESSVAMAELRLAACERLNMAMSQLNPAFPKAQLSLKGLAENMLHDAEKPALQIEEILQQAFEQDRTSDSQSGRMANGAHKTQLNVVFAPKGVEAAYCSTGEQKALMLSLLLAQAQAMKHQQGRLPILLLDEVVAHLDIGRRSALFEALDELNAQCFMTGTDAHLFEGFTAQKISLESV